MIRSFSIIFLSLWLCTACDGSSANHQPVAGAQSETAVESESEQLAQIEYHVLDEEEQTPYPVAVRLDIRGVPGSDFELHVNQTLLKQGRIPQKAAVEGGLASLDTLIILNNSEDHLFYLEMNTPNDGRVDDFKMVTVKPRQCMDDETFYEQHIQSTVEADCAACHGAESDTAWRSDEGLAGIEAYVQSRGGQGLIWAAVRNRHGDGVIWSIDDAPLRRMAELVYRIQNDYTCEQTDVSAQLESAPTFHF